MDAVGCDRDVGPEESRTTFVSRDERSCLPRCHPHSAMPHSRDRQVFRPRARRPRAPPIGAALYRWRSAPKPTGRRVSLCGGSCRVRSGGSRVHSPPSPLRFPPATGSLGRRATGTRPVLSHIRDEAAKSRGAVGETSSAVSDGPDGASPRRHRSEIWRRGWDSNPRTFRSTVFKTAAIVRSATSPRGIVRPALVQPATPHCRVGR